jgi:pyruvate/2-oxoglutarate dehydrogenase complex dihydrolipoamide acyltransferase (E2) component
MIYRLVVPDTIEDMDSVRVLEWHKAPGQPLAAGELLVELETHKALIEVRAAQSAILRTILCAEGEWCPLGGPLALLGDDEAEPLPTEDARYAPWMADFSIG